jgi:mannose-6-phosphate isomerase-like protein (cupin superfamily)
LAGLKERKMKEGIKRMEIGSEFFTGERCYIVEISNTPDDPDVSIARARVPPGGSTRWHRLIGTAERYIILEGRGLVEAGGLSPHEVGAGDVVLIPPMCRQRITNIGPSDLIFLAICTPRFKPEAYEDIEEEVNGSR